jgi:putative ABC transport system substrate-binding protein
VKRREFSMLIGGAVVAWPFAVRARQTDRVARIGVLMGDAASDPEGQTRVAAFREKLERLGWTQGRNIQIEYRWASGDIERTRTFAAALVRMAPEPERSPHNEDNGRDDQAPE